MLKSKKCPICNNKANPIIEEYTSSKIDPRNNQKISVKNVATYSCTNSECGHTWLPLAEEQKIDHHIDSLSRFDLDMKQITLLRESLGFNTKAQAAKFLCLNEKAFTRWELGYSCPNRAYDLLLRLAAFSKNNFNFIKEQHEKNFKFNPNDYQLVKVITVSKQHLYNSDNYSTDAYCKSGHQRYNDSSTQPCPVKTTVEPLRDQECPLAA